MVFAFSLAEAGNGKNVATLSYELEQQRDDKMLLLKLQGVRFLSTADEGFKKVLLKHVSVNMWYYKGRSIEELFPGWRQAGYAAKDITDFDVSFEKFWGLYGKKVGNKAGVAKKWERLSWDEKVMAMGCVPRMRRYYEQRGIELPYPETYINQRRWENEFDG